MEKKNDLTFEKAYAALEETVDKMNAASVPLDELMKLYEEGMALAARCETLLTGYEARLEKIRKQTIDEEREKIEEEPQKALPSCDDEEEAPF